MKLRDARNYLDGKTKVTGDGTISFLDRVGITIIDLSKSDIEFCLRQLALKTVREKEKGK